MAEFFSKTWFLWWAIAVVVIVRWFQVAAPETPSIPVPPPPRKDAVPTHPIN
jgi:hypothetical protein